MVQYTFLGEYTVHLVQYTFLGKYTAHLVQYTFLGEYTAHLVQYTFLGDYIGKVSIPLSLLIVSNKHILAITEFTYSVEQCTAHPSCTIPPPVHL